MGNNIGGRKKAKIMRLDGEILKIKTPSTALDVLKDYSPSYVLLESESVKRYGIRAPKLQPEEELKPKRIYFLVEMPEFPFESMSITRRSRSAVQHMGGAEERLKSMMLRERSNSDISCSHSGSVRVKMRLPRAQIGKLIEENRNEEELAERILELCLKRCREEKAR
ncbi:hypothetical protein F511_13351 [Dorcoceras hygrometricum]|uniref:Uncharacterized protein n=1 Tax=Dorcoceras hygrometricum TaxID=472368 RepID=A0A2Z7C5Z5_9LAMI|nr:hypothetical protein F511_13351 [Dorcoceras hygrometricum]